MNVESRARSAGPLLLLGLVVGCSATAGDRARAATPQKEKESEILGWRLVEKPYGEIEDAWVFVGDGLIPPRHEALVYEPVYREEKTLVPKLVTARSACEHAAHASYDGPPSVNTGQPVTVTVWVEGPRDVAHVVEFERTHPHVEIQEIVGAAPLAGEPSRHLLEPGARVRVTFTSRISGAGGVRVSVVGEVVYVGGDTRAVRK